MSLTIPGWNKRRRKPGRVGVSVGPDGLAVAYIGAGGELGFHCCFEQPDGVAETLTRLVDEQQWQDTPCTLVLHPAYYQVLLTEVPNVEVAEMAEAVRWRIKDLLSYAVDTAAIEYFRLPEDAYRGRQKMLYAAALQKDSLQSLAAPVEQAGLALDTIDIVELVTLNILNRLPPTQGAVAIMHLYGAEGVLNLVEDGQIYLTRRVDFGLDQYRQASNPQAVRDALLLEVQRSLDYYESQMGKGIVTNLYFSPAADGLGDFLNQQLGLHVSTPDLEAILPAPLSEDSESCLTAIAAALGSVSSEELAQRAAG